MVKHRRKSRGEIEQSINEVGLREDVPETFRDETNLKEDHQTADTSQNWSRPEDRSEDLINETDPFIQQPEKGTQIPPELIQQKAYYLYEQRGADHGQDLVDWFEAERQLRQETHLTLKTRIK